MTTILDEFPYPWHKKEAQQLHMTLCQSVSTVAGVTFMAKAAGIDTGQLFTEQAVYLVWANLLDLAALSGKTRVLVEEVTKRQSPTSPVRPFLDDLLASKAVTLTAEPRGADGSPVFLNGTDEITEPEALLYKDDLTFRIGRVPQLIGTLQKLLILAPGVCRLSVDIHGTTQTGTGFRIGNDLLLTNWHVVHRSSDEAPATAVTAEFLYDDDGAGGFVQPQTISCDAGSIRSVKEDDWAVIASNEKLNDAWPVIKLSENVAPTPNSAAYIIQHPGGDRKRIGFVRNQVSDFDNRLVHYLTDTQEGSSGAPVFDQEGKIFALHHAGGRPQEVAGKPPLIKNEGIRITRVVEGLNRQAIAFG